MATMKHQICFQKATREGGILRPWESSDLKTWAPASTVGSTVNNDKYRKDNIVNVGSTAATNNSNDNVVNDISTTAQQSIHNSGSHDNHKGTE
jgi:hypothetical protein